MQTIWSIFSVKWARYVTALLLVLGMAFFMATACDDDCGFQTIDFTPVVDEDECLADCEANFCDDCDFEPPNGCTGFNCDICVIIDDDDIL
jgi:hypothetical protein